MEGPEMQTCCQIFTEVIIQHIGWDNCELGQTTWSGELHEPHWHTHWESIDFQFQSCSEQIDPLVDCREKEYL